MADDEKTSEKAYWTAFCKATGVSGACPPSDQFGDTPALADELLALVLKGQKQATCELKRRFDSRNIPMPKAGDYWMITNGQGEPKSIIQTTQVDLCSVKDVDAKFAWDEGEGDRSLSYWKAEHDAYYHRQAKRDGFLYSDDIICVCERFKRVWPI